MAPTPRSRGPFHLRGVEEAVVRLEEDPAGDEPEAESIQEGCEHLRPVEAEGRPGRGGPVGDPHGHQRKRDGGGVGQHVGSIGQQGEAPGEDAADHLHEHEASNEAQGQDQAPFAGSTQVMGVVMAAVPVMVMAVARVPMIVARVVMVMIIVVMVMALVVVVMALVVVSVVMALVVVFVVMALMVVGVVMVVGRVVVLVVMRCVVMLMVVGVVMLMVVSMVVVVGRVVVLVVMRCVVVVMLVVVIVPVFSCHNGSPSCNTGCPASVSSAGHPTCDSFGLRVSSMQQRGRRGGGHPQRRSARHRARGSGCGRARPCPPGP